MEGVKCGINNHELMSTFSSSAYKHCGITNTKYGTNRCFGILFTCTYGLGKKILVSKLKVSTN